MSGIFDDATTLAHQHLDAPTAEAWLQLVRPAVALVEPTPDDAVVARLGGLPRLPVGTPWPQLGTSIPLSYVGELDLAALAVTGHKPDIPLPVVGRLAFFVLDNSDGYGFADGSDLDSYRVLHLTEEGSPIATPAGAFTYAEQALTARQVVTSPDSFDPALPLAFGVDVDADYPAWLDHSVQAPAFLDALEHLRGSLPQHQVGGWAIAVQGPVEIQAAHADVRRRSLQLVADDRTGAVSQDLPSETDQWVLLFQVDSYDGAQWGDVGTLYWLARTEDLARGDLSNTRFVMQCC
ncbi:YwqG family protein [Promicromonospora sp. NPDC057488]|uniref:YwqG family protein n=1 Tax=Promicromonospora sp. NPDC057488 TaxID=3346147 RepID=UPI00366B101D